MSDPRPVTGELVSGPPTQTAYPWRATVRTVFAALVALASIVPYIVTAAGLDGWAYAGQVVIVAGAITRVMALPGVNDWISRFVPWLAPEPAPTAAAVVDGAYVVTSLPGDAGTDSGSYDPDDDALDHPGGLER